MRSRAPGPRRVLMTADAVGGVFTYALDLAAFLCGLGIEVIVAVSGPPPSDAQRLALRAAGASLVEIDAPLEWTAPTEAALQAAAERLAGVAADVRPDLVHINNPALADYARFQVPLLGVCHSCLATWWDAVRSGPPPEDFVWRISASARGYAACDALVAPSRAFAAATMRAYNIAMPAVIHNGRREPRDMASLLKEPLVLTAGRLWDEGKDMRTLDRAAARLGVPVVALGSTAAPNGHAPRFDALETSGAVSADAVERWMGRAQVFASTALYEPFGLAVLEAASAGCALVLSDIPSFRELWDGAARFVSPGDAEGFAGAIQRLLTSPEARQEGSRDARRRAERYGLAPMAEAYLSLYGALWEREAAA